jgi:hypothetical protein
MKYILMAVVVFSMAISFAVIVTRASDNASATRVETREYPVAAGVWYPGDGDIPEKPMRYYRARCWPGCHVGSSQYGMFPETDLEKDQPIWPTSTIDRVADGTIKTD